MDTLKTYKKPLFAGVLLLLLILAYFQRDKIKALFSKSTTTGGGTTSGGSNTTTTTNNTTTTTAINKDKSLSLGSKGQEVEELQRLINKNITPPMVMLVVDGNFGPKTEAALLNVAKVKSITINQFLKLNPAIPSALDYL